MLLASFMGANIDYLSPEISFLLYQSFLKHIDLEKASAKKKKNYKRKKF